jgi:hypothetical protein
MEVECGRGRNPPATISRPTSVESRHHEQPPNFIGAYQIATDRVFLELVLRLPACVFKPLEPLETKAAVASG